jgi:hypothetical protein
MCTKPGGIGAPRVLGRADVVIYVRRFEGLRDAISANRLIALLSIVFENAAGIGSCTYSPCIRADRNQETARKKVLTEDVRGNIALRFCCRASSHPALLLSTLDSAPGARRGQPLVARGNHKADRLAK